MPADAAPRPLVAASIELITRHQTPTGAYVAAPGFDTYNYSWLRDGAFIAAAMDTHGHRDCAANFHQWATGTIRRFAHKIKALETDPGLALKGTGDPLQPLDDRYVLHTRFTVDGDEGHDQWGNFQLDGYGFWLSSVTHHLVHTGTDPAQYRDAIDLVCRYLTVTWQHPCFDSWEEYPTRRHMTTWAAVAKGLDDAGNLIGHQTATDAATEITRQLVAATGPSATLRKFVPEPETLHRPPATPPSNPPGRAVAGHERIGPPLDPDTLDGSALLVLNRFGPFPPNHPIYAQTLATVDDTLVVNGGVHRYLEDEYYGGGLWIVLAGALALAHAPHNPHRAQEVLTWIESHADNFGHLGEQTPTHLRKPRSLKPWTERWGPPASPLLWSHAMYLLAVAAVSESASPATADSETCIGH